MTQNPQMVDLKLTTFTPIAHNASQQLLRLKPPFRPPNPVKGLKTEKRFEIIARVNIPVANQNASQSLSARLFTTLHMQYTKLVNTHTQGGNETQYQ